ncbi:uncharacterized protein LOC124951175 [Vespa velutina]|uniref:uncharacterized protein LOC124951175 n=1 Tax=Vespa velutina TaxID=202808 RepID=UPI001FB2742D|nr:uncharacterized protein LOC124951175 [Vespa velutina]
MEESLFCKLALISKILLYRIETTLDKQLGEYQAGFRKDFKKVFDSVDRETIDKTIREFGVKNKLANIIHETLNDTISKVKFMGEISKPVEINVGVRQDDGSSPLLFNCVLEKIIRIWNVKLKEHNNSPVTLGRKNKGIEISCLAFADNFAIVSDNLKSATTQINLLKKIANKACLKISVEKNKFITNIKNGQKFVTTESGKSKEIQIPGRNNSRKWFRKICSRRKVVKSECLYASECLVLNYRLDKLEVLERRIMRKILGPVKTTEVWKLRSKDEIYRKIEGITETIRKRKLQFFDHIYKMDDTD